MRTVISRGVTLAVLAPVLVCGCARTPTSPTAPPKASPILKVLGPVTILVPGESAQLQAVKYENGGQTDRTTSAIWSSSDTSVVTVSSTGLALAVAPGNADVSAMVDGLTAAIGIRVTPSHGQLTGQIDPEVAADIIGYNQDVPSNKHKGMITRFDLPIRLYVDPSFRSAFGDYAERAVKSWQSLTGLPVVFLDRNVEPRIQMIVLPTADNRARAVTDSVNLDNSLRGVSVIIPSAWWGMSWASAGVQTVHEVGHALGILGHPPWRGVMAHLEYGVPQTATEGNAREARLLVELYKLPLGTHVEPDGTWLVR